MKIKSCGFSTLLHVQSTDNSDSIFVRDQLVTVRLKNSDEYTGRIHNFNIFEQLLIIKTPQNTQIQIELDSIDSIS